MRTLLLVTTSLTFLLSACSGEEGSVSAEDCSSEGLVRVWLSDAFECRQPCTEDTDCTGDDETCAFIGASCETCDDLVQVCD